MSRDQSRREPHQLFRQETHNLLIPDILKNKTSIINTLSNESRPSPDLTCLDLIL